MKLSDRFQLKNKTWLRLIELAEEWEKEASCELSSDEILTEIWAGFWRGEFEREKEIVFYFTIDKDAYGWSRETLFNMLKNSLGLKLKRTISGWSTEERSGWSFAETFEKTVNEWSTDEGHQKEYEKLSEWSFEMFKKTLNENSRDSVAFSAYVSPMGIDRTDLLAWCSGKGISPPDFWADVEAHEKEPAFAGRAPNPDRAPIKAELRRRAESGEMLLKISKEANYLEEWAITAVPNGAHSKAGTIRNNIRVLYNSLKPAKT